MKLVCLGDSLTYGYEVRRSAVWTNLVQAWTGATVHNCGINGMTTTGMLHRFTSDVLSETPHAVLLMGGANDILSGLDASEPEKNLATMIIRAREAGIKALVGIPIPFCPPIREDWAALADFSVMAPRYDAFTERLPDLIEKFEADAVDFRSGMAEHLARTGLPPQSLYHDGIHLSEAGHKVFADILINDMKRLRLLPKT